MARSWGFAEQRGDEFVGCWFTEKGFVEVYRDNGKENGNCYLGFRV